LERTRLLGFATLLAFVVLSAGASAALVRVNGLVLTADGGFTPRLLPRHAFAPIDFRGAANLKAVGGGAPPPLRQAVIQFDRDGRLETDGLPTCKPEMLAEATTAEARRLCAGAIVGTGHVSALIPLPILGDVRASSPVTFFNGPPQDGHPTAILHARTTVPAVQTFVIVIPIERRGGAYRYRATIDVPPIFGGIGSLVHLDAKIGRHYRYRGRKRSYASARCGNGILRTRGRFTFADGTIIEGSVEKGCTVRR
jgi:hypothetical protein